MIKVLLVTKLFYPVYGGVETTVAQLAQWLVADGNYEVTIVAGNERPALETKTYQWKSVNIIKTAGAGTIFNTAISPQYLSLLNKLIHSHDIIHFHTPHPLADLSFAFYHIPPDKKIVVTVHADITQTRKKFVGRPYNYFLSKLLKRADVITTMSPQNRDGFRVLQPFLDKCQVIPLAYNAEHIRVIRDADKNDFCSKFNIDTQKKLVLFVGRLNRHKGLDYLFEAMQNAADIQLIIAGNGELFTSFRQKAAKMNLDAIFTGFIEGTEMASAYSLSDVFVLPSLAETYGIVQAEAMYFGLPVVNTALHTGVNFISIHNETGITVSPADATALGAAIRLVLNDDELRKKFSANAKQRSALFTPEIMVQGYKDVYNSI